MTTLISTLKNGKTSFFTLLSQRMAEKGDFPALSKSLQSFEESIQDEDSNTSDITSAILKDFTLTQKVIKLANSAMYSGMGGEITTITHASVVLGMDAISHLALSIRFIDTLSSSAPNSENAHQELEKAILAGDITRNIVTKMNMTNGEEAVVCTLMHHLGRLLLVFYFPKEWNKIQEIAEGELSRENDATLQVIGVSIDEIAQEVAKDWRLPKKISHCMKSSDLNHEKSAPGSINWLKDIANFSGEVATKVANKSNKNDIKEIISRYDSALQISSKDIAESIELAKKMAKEKTEQSETEHADGKPTDSQERLMAAISEVNEMLNKGENLGSAISLVLETMYASMGFNRVVAFFCGAGEFKAKVGFGSMMPETLPQLIFPEDYAADVFHLSLANKADVFIEEVSSIKVASSIPVWFKEALPDVGAFILLPIVFKDRAVGLIYADWRVGVAGMVEPGELSSMGVLRDHLLKALAKKQDKARTKNIGAAYN